MIKLYVYLLVVLIGFSCSSNIRQVDNNTINNSDSKITIDSFKYDGLFVRYLSDWKLVENVDQDNTKILTWDKGSESSGQFIVTIRKSFSTLNFVLDILRSNLLEVIPIDKSLIKLSEVKSVKYLDIDALDQNYNYEYKGSKIFVRLLVFKKNDKTYTLLFQSDEFDMELNKKGFDFFENNLKINTR